MYFVIHAFDKKDSSIRKDNYPTHLAFLNEASKYGVKIVMSGPLVLDDGVTPVGSHFIIDAADRTKAEAFHHADPFFTAGLWEKTTVIAFLKRIG